MSKNSSTSRHGQEDVLQLVSCPLFVALILSLSSSRVDIPAGLTFDLHEASCRKYCKYCRECGETVPLSELSAHESKAHTPTPCPQCRASVHPAHTDSHKVSPYIGRLP